MQQERIKLVTVVHPGGKKFMGLLLDLIAITIKEVMKRRKAPTGKSLDIGKVTDVCLNMKQVEMELVNVIKEDVKLIKSKNQAIEELLNKVGVHELPCSSEEFFLRWHDDNKSRIECDNRNSKIMEDIKQQADKLFRKADNMLMPLKHSSENFTVAQMNSVAEHYHNYLEISENIPKLTTGGHVNIQWLLTGLNFALPDIINFISSYSFTKPNSHHEELKILSRLAQDVPKVSLQLKNFEELWKKFYTSTMTAKEKIKHDREENGEAEDDETERAIRFADEREKLKPYIINTPKVYFDASVNCLKNVKVNKTRLPLVFDDDTENNETIMSQTKIFRPITQSLKEKSLNHSPKSEMGPPNMSQQGRRRRDAMELLERATSTGRNNMNSSKRYMENVSKHTLGRNLHHHSSNPHLSSTMISPDMRQLGEHFKFNPNLSTISDISRISKSSPVTSLEPISIHKRENLQLRESEVKQDKLPSYDEFPWNDLEKIKALQKSPMGKLVSNIKMDQLFELPKFQIDDATINTSSNASTFSSESQNTIRIQDSMDITFFQSMKMPADEDLFNISDTILNDIE